MQLEAFKNMGEVMTGFGQTITGFSALIIKDDKPAIAEMTDMMRSIISIVAVMTINSELSEHKKTQTMRMLQLAAQGVQLVVEADRTSDTIGHTMDNGWTMLAAGALVNSKDPEFLGASVPKIDTKEAIKKATDYLLEKVPDGVRNDPSIRESLIAAGLMDEHGKATLH